MHGSSLLPSVSATSPVSQWRETGSFLCIFFLLLVSGCEPGDREATVTKAERRSLVLWDEAYPNNLRDQAPPDWRKVPWTQMRYYNYRFGVKQDGEVWLSVLPRQSLDAVLANVNRWYNQFRLPEITSLESLPQRPMLNATGYLIEAEGTYNPGMGAPPRPNTRMLAAAIPRGDIIVTVKMIGSPAEVEGQQEAFAAYCESLKFFDRANIPKSGEEA
mgnify:CR=1 FL=1